MTSERYDVAIIGGGVVGAALAFGMRSLGERLIVLDAGEAHVATHGNFGLVWVQGKGLGLPAYVDWTLRSARAWPRLAEGLRAHAGSDVALAQTGGLHVCLSEHEMQARAARLARLFAQTGVERYDVRMVTRAELVARLPMLGPEVAGGSFCALDGHCNPLALLSALNASLLRSGVTRRTRHRVDAIEAGGGRFRLHGQQTTIDAERIVIAAGRGTTALAAMVDVRVPLVANSGEILVLERMRPFLPFALETIRQTDEGAVLIGDSHEPRVDPALDFAVLGAIARRAQRMIPALTGARVVRSWAAARVYAPDGFPVYAQSSTHPGAFAVAVHSGVTLAAVHAFELAPAILAGTLPASLQPLSPSRFDHVRAVA